MKETTEESKIPASSGASNPGPLAAESKMLPPLQAGKLEHERITRRSLNPTNNSLHLDFTLGKILRKDILADLTNMVPR